MLELIEAKESAEGWAHLAGDGYAHGYDKFGIDREESSISSTGLFKLERWSPNFQDVVCIWALLFMVHGLGKLAIRRTSFRRSHLS